MDSASVFLILIILAIIIGMLMYFVDMRQKNSVTVVSVPPDMELTEPDVEEEV